MSIQIDHLSFSYGDHQVLKDVSLTANKGELLSLLGPNGVGKSTLFKCVLGLLHGYSGEAYLEGDSTRQLDRKSVV